MAQTRNRGQGKAKDAVMSHELTNDPDGEVFDDLEAFIRGKSAITVRAKRGVGMIGYEPGDDLNTAPHMIPLKVDCVARLPIEPAGTRKENQDATMLALYVANGALDIIPDKEFDSAPKNDEVRKAQREESRKRQLESGADMNLLDQIAAMRAEIAELKKKK